MQVSLHSLGNCSAVGKERARNSKPTTGTDPKTLWDYGHMTMDIDTCPAVPHVWKA